MLRWLSLVLVLATSVAVFADPSIESKESSDAPPRCRAHAWVRAPDMVPGDVIAGDIKVKLSGPCTGAESYVLGLRYKEKIFWKLRREDAPIPKRPQVKYNSMDNRDLFHVGIPFQNTNNANYNETEWMTYKNSVQNQDLWSVREDERMAFEIKTPLVSTEGAEPLPTIFTTQFGVLVPNTNYPPGLDHRINAMGSFNRGGTNTISSESVYEYFVEITFSNGTVSEVPAGITTFTPVYHPTDNDASRVSVSLEYRGPIPNLEPSVDMLRSNYTIEIQFPDGAHVYQNSTVNMTATVHRIGYTNRTDIPMKLCASLREPNVIEWHPQELKNRSQSNRSQPSMDIPLTNALVPSMQFDTPHTVDSFPCREIDFAAAPTNLTHEGHISSTSSEPLSLSIYVVRNTVPDFLTYYRKLEHRIGLNLHIKPDPSEPWVNEYEKRQWEKEIADMDETDFDWVPWTSMTHTRRQFFNGDANISVIPMQKQGPVRSTPVHYLSDKARQPLFVNLSDIVDLRLMSPEERNLIAPLAQPSIKVFPKGEELLHRYFAGADMQRPIYVGDTWVKKVLPIVDERQRERDTMDRLLVVQ